MPERCRVCRKAATLKCSRCGESWYCTRECQATHWVEHKKVCRQIAEIKTLAAPSKEGDNTLAEDERIQRLLAAAAQVGGEAFAAALDVEMRGGLGDWRVSGLDPRASMLQQRLSACAARGDVAGVREVLGQGAKVDAPAALGPLPLHAAAAGGHAEVIQHLAASGADLDKRDRHGMTPLHLAVAQCSSARHIAAVLALGAAGARFESVVGGAGAAAAAPAAPPASTAEAAGAAGTGAAAPAPGGTAGLPPPPPPASGNSSGGSDGISGRSLLHLAAACEGWKEAGAGGAGDGSALLVRAVILGCAGALRPASSAAAAAGGEAAAAAPADGSSGSIPASTAGSVPVMAVEALGSAALPTLDAAVVDSPDPDGLTPLVYTCAHGQVGAARALLQAGASVHGRLQATAGSSPSAAATAGGSSAGSVDPRQSDPSTMPITFALEGYASAVQEARANADAAVNEKDGDVKAELEAAVAKAQASQARFLSVLRLLFAHGAVLPVVPSVDATAFENMAWEEAGIGLGLATSGAAITAEGSAAAAAAAAAGKGGKKVGSAGGSAKALTLEETPEVVDGAGLLLPQLAAACTDSALAPVVQLCLQEGKASPAPVSNDGRTTPLHVACMALNVPAATALLAAMGHGNGTGSGSALPLPPAEGLEKCIKAGLAWADAQAGELTPAGAKEVVASAKASAAALRSVLGVPAEA